MVGIALAPEAAQAAVVVGTVLVQAVVLHVVYGGVERVVAPRLTAVIEAVP